MDRTRTRSTKHCKYKNNYEKSMNSPNHLSLHTSAQPKKNTTLTCRGQCRLSVSLMGKLCSHVGPDDDLCLNHTLDIGIAVWNAAGWGQGQLVDIGDMHRLLCHYLPPCLRLHGKPPEEDLSTSSESWLVHPAALCGQQHWPCPQLLCAKQKRPK